MLYEDLIFHRMDVNDGRIGFWLPYDLVLVENGRWVDAGKDLFDVADHALNFQERQFVERQELYPQVRIGQIGILDGHQR